MAGEYKKGNENLMEKILLKDYSKICDGKFLKMYKATFAGTKGEKVYEIVSRKDSPEFLGAESKVDAIKILPYLKKDGKIFVYLIREFRFPIAKQIYELPSGLVDEGEDPCDSARRELLEEIGAVAKSVEKMETCAYSSAGMSDESLEFYIAEVDHFENQDLEASEYIDVEEVELEKLDDYLVKENFCALSKLQLRIFQLKMENLRLKDELKKLKSSKI